MRRRKYFIFKRIMDISLSVFLLITLFPLMLLISIIILIKMGRPIFFYQRRPGYKKKIFTIIKFRTMNNFTNEHGILLNDSKRITKIGSFLRKTSLDELPTLLNVLKGDMSFVGPRPLLVKYLKLYNKRQIKRQNIKPGITGLAQIKGRNLLSWEDKIEYDVMYSEKINFFIDIKILFFTLFLVISRKGITSKNSSSMEEFKG